MGDGEDSIFLVASLVYRGLHDLNPMHFIVLGVLTSI